MGYEGSLGDMKGTQKALLTGPQKLAENSSFEQKIWKIQAVCCWPWPVS